MPVAKNGANIWTNEFQLKRYASEHLPTIPRGKDHCTAGAYYIKLYRSVNYGFIDTAKFDSKFAHNFKNSVIYGHFAANYEEKSSMEQAPVSCLSGLFSFSLLLQRRPTERGRSAVWLVSSLNRYDLTKEVDILECSETVESKLVKLETSRTMIPLPTLSIEISEGYLVLFPWPQTSR